jgi:probable HAF family extracellular repeat protein
MAANRFAFGLKQVLFAAEVLSVVLAIAPVALFSQPAYTVTPLGTLGGTASSAIALNNAGQVVGYAFTTGNAASHAVLFSGTSSGNLDLGNLDAGANSTSYAYGINDAGQIVGEAVAPSGFSHATLISGTGSGNLDLGGEENARLGWSDGGNWVLAVDGNSGGTPTFVAGAWNSGYTLGYHGVDTATNTVWAVVNHSNDFSVIGVPLPGVPGDYNDNGVVDAADYVL